jgi:hypothetical protein
MSKKHAFRFTIYAYDLSDEDAAIFARHLDESASACHVMTGSRTMMVGIQGPEVGTAEHAAMLAESIRVQADLVARGVEELGREERTEGPSPVSTMPAPKGVN